MIENEKLKTLICLLIPLAIYGTMMVCMMTVTAIQNFFIALLNDCTFGLQNILKLITVGVLNVVLALPTVFYEIALGYACNQSYLIPIMITTAAKLIGESTCFCIGYYLSDSIKPFFLKYRICKAVDAVAAEQPLLVSFLLRVNGWTPSFIINYGSGVLQSIPFLIFISVALAINIPHCILANIIGKEIQVLQFSLTMPDQNNGSIEIILPILTVLGLLSFAFLSYKIKQNYEKLLPLNLEEEQNPQVQKV